MTNIVTTKFSVFNAKQISETIFSSSINQGKQGLIDQFIAGGPNRSKDELKKFAADAIGENVNDVDKLVNMPTLVILGCALATTVLAVLTLLLT